MWQAATTKGWWYRLHRFRAHAPRPVGCTWGQPPQPQHEHSLVHKWVMSFRGTLQGNSMKSPCRGCPEISDPLWSSFDFWAKTTSSLLPFVCQRLGWRICEELPTPCKLVLCMKTCQVPPDLQGCKRCCPEGPWEGEISNQMIHQPSWSLGGCSVPF